jgi:KipI family sensor histidine kinase inhibitor
MNDGPVRLRPFGDSGVLVDVADAASIQVARRVHRLARAIRAATAGRRGWSAPIPAAGSLLVPVDALNPGVEAAMETLTPMVEGPLEPGDDAAVTLVEIPTRYGGADGPDLASIAELHGLTEAAVIELHASVEYDVLFLGFAPGFAYLGELPEAIATPRLTTPRVRVPAGSVAIAGRQTAVYPFESPGGWQLIGRTSVVLWDVTREAPALLTPGARVRFVPVN